MGDDLGDGADDTELTWRALAEDETWERLSQSSVGRIAMSVAGEPDIFPLRYAVHDGRLWMRTSPGTKLAEMTVNDRVAFEVDHVAEAEAEAWSVVVKGRARVLETRAEIEKAESFALRSWMPATKRVWVVLEPDEVEGRHYHLGSGSA